MTGDRKYPRTVSMATTSGTTTLRAGRCIKDRPKAASVCHGTAVKRVVLEPKRLTCKGSVCYSTFELLYSYHWVSRYSNSTYRKIISHTCCCVSSPSIFHVQFILHQLVVPQPRPSPSHLFQIHHHFHHQNHLPTFPGSHTPYRWFEQSPCL